MKAIDPKATTVSAATLRNRLFVGVSLANLAVAVLLGLSLAQSSMQYRERAAISTRNLSLVLEKQLQGTIEKADLALQAVADEVGDDPGGGAHSGTRLNAGLVRLCGRLPELDGLRATDAKGNVLYGAGLLPGKPVNCADRDFFRLQRANPAAGLVISEPILGRIGGQWTLALSRRLNRPDGSFAGIVYAVISLEQIGRILSRLDVGPHGSVALRDGRLGLIVRYPEFKGAGGGIGERVVSAALQERVRLAPDSGDYLARAPIDRIERIFSYRKVGRYPLYVNVGFASVDYLAQWRNLAGYAAGVAGLCLLGTLLSSRLIYASWRRGASAVEELVASKEQIRLLLESTAEAIYGVDLHGCCTFANPACVRLLGYESAEELLGRQMHELCHHSHPDGAPFPVAECRISQSFQDGLGIHTDELTFWRRDGSHFPVECWSYPQLKNGQLVGAVVTFLDIRDRLQAEEALRANEEKFRMLFESSADPCLLIDGNAFVDCNQATVELLHASGKAEVLNTHPWEISPEFQPDGRPSLQKANEMIRAAKSRGVQRFEWLHCRKDGSLFPVEVSLTRLPENGMIYTVWRDITKRKEAEASLAGYRDHLEELVERRTRELLAAKEAAEAADRAKSAFMANMSHELRTPLNAIIGFSELTLQKALSAEQQSHLRKIQGAGRSLLAMINELLDFARSGETGGAEPELERRRFRLEEVLAGEIAAAQQKALAKGIDLLVSIDADLPQQLEGDATRLGQLLGHLLDNAVKFTGQGEVELRVSRLPAGEDTLALSFGVRDSGIGIDPQRLSDLFQSFSQLDPSATRNFGGTGVGLAVCRRLAAAMGGEITVESRPGAGSNFTLVARFPGVDRPLPGEPTGGLIPAGSPFPWIETGYARSWADSHGKLYLATAAKFGKEQQRLAERLAALLPAGDRAEALACLRRLQGLAGTLGAAGIRQAAFSLEQAVQAGRDPSGSLERLAACSLRLLDQLAQATLVPQRPGAADDAPCEIGTILRHLERYAKESDGEAAGYLTAVIDRLREALPAAPWDEIERLLEGYEMDRAAALLRQVIGKL